MIKVLIVEDDPMVADINKSYVESSENFKVVKTLQNGKDALRFLINNEDIDLIIVDIFMPEMNGIDLIRELRKRQINVDIILITASKHIKDIKTALKFGAVDYLVKPFTFDRFLASIEKYESRYNRMNELSNKEELTQDYIDSLLPGREKEKNILPKGLEEKTFKRIYKFLQRPDVEKFTLHEVSIELEITTVTIRKYLKHMEKLGYVRLQKEYGDVGRPKAVYHNLLKSKSRQ